MKKKFKLVTLLGIRPDIIRMHKLIALLDKHQNRYNYEHIFAHTGQHYDFELDAVFYEELDVRLPDYNFNVGKTLKELKQSTDYVNQTNLLYSKTDEFLRKVKPDAVMYLGDTNSVVSSFIVARSNVPVIHIESGGRSFDWRMPEEKCRILIDHMSDLLYCYLPRYKEILLREGIPSYRIKVVGNIIVDAIESFAKQAQKKKAYKKFSVQRGKFVLVTIHREENISNPKNFKKKIEDLVLISKKRPVVFPIMPRVKKQIQKLGLTSIIRKSNIIATDPLGFFDFLSLESSAEGIITDSGTVQEEALILGVPCVVARRSTERPETIYAGATIMSEDNLADSLDQALKLQKNWNRTILNPTLKSPSQTIFNDLMKRIGNGFFSSSRSRRYIESDFYARLAHGNFPIY